MKVRVDLPFSIQCVTRDALLAERISFFFLEHPRFTVSFTPDLPLLPDTDLLVIPAAAFAEDGFPVPAIACGSDSDFRLPGLSGCADFLREPWEPGELYWRACRILTARRLGFSRDAVSIYPTRLVCGSLEVPLSSREYRLLSLLARFPGEAVSREALRAALGTSAPVQSRSVDMQISALRKKLSALGDDAPCIQAVRDWGYRIV